MITEQELRIKQWMAEGNRLAVQASLDAERALQLFGKGNKQVIASCKAWLDEHGFSDLSVSI